MAPRRRIAVAVPAILRGDVRRLNGDVHVECAACDETHACNPTALDFERNRVVAVNTFGKMSWPKQMLIAASTAAAAAAGRLEKRHSTMSWQPIRKSLQGPAFPLQISRTHPFWRDGGRTASSIERVRRLLARTAWKGPSASRSAPHS